MALKFGWGSKPKDDDAVATLTQDRAAPKVGGLRFTRQAPNKSGVTLLHAASDDLGVEVAQAASPVVRGVPQSIDQIIVTQSEQVERHEIPTQNETAPESRALVAVVSSPVEQQPRLHKISELENIKGDVPGIVTKGIASKCAVVDHGYGKVTIVCLVEFLGLPQYQTVKQQLAGKSKVAQTLVAEADVLAEVQVQIKRINDHQRMVARDGSDGNIVLYNDLIADAHAIGATDIHCLLVGDGLTKNDTESQVRLRVAGRMHHWKYFPTTVLFDALAAGYGKLSVSGTNSGGQYQTGAPENTITRHEVMTKSGTMRTVSGRFTSTPTVGGGAKITIRLLDTDVRDVRIPTFKDLGYTDSQNYQQIMPALLKNQGMIMVVGPTGSGKSTTLRTAMDLLPDKESLERYSLEDPVEYVLPGVVQVSIQRTSDDSEESVRLKLQSRLRDLMRMDPDVVMIGEIRDEETAKLATEMNLTGHRVFTTFHGNGVIDGLTRATGGTIKIPSETLASHGFLSSVMYQKLMPKLCPHCRIHSSKGWLTREQKDAVTKKFKLDLGTIYLANPDGCDVCNIGDIRSDGRVGLTVAAEVLTLDRKLLEFVKDMDWLGARDHWRGQRRTAYGDPDMTGKTSFEHAIYLLSSGVIDIHDIERDYEPLSTYELAEMAGGEYV